MTGAEKSLLRGQAMGLSPALAVGKEGVTPTVLAELDLHLRRAKLVKVRLPVLEKASRQALVERLAAETTSEVVGIVGHTAALYRAGVSS